MARLLDRLQPSNAPGLPRGLYTNQQRVCEQIEAQFVSLFEALTSMPDIADVHISADYTGTPDSGQFPVIVQASRFTSTTDNTTDATWGFAVDSGALTASITDGALSITAITATSGVTITSTYGGVDKSRSFTTYLDIAAPPVTGTSGGGSSYATSFTNITSATHAPVSADLTVVVGGSGIVTLRAPLIVSTASAAPSGTYKVWGKWQWWNGAAWTDLAAEVASSPDCKVRSSLTVNNGTLSVPDSKGGLGVGTSQKFRLEARNDSGTRTMTLSGTASAVS